MMPRKLAHAWRWFGCVAATMMEVIMTARAWTTQTIATPIAVRYVACFLGRGSDVAAAAAGSRGKNTTKRRRLNSRLGSNSFDLQRKERH